MLAINDNTLNDVTVDDLRGVTTVWHTLDLDDPTTGLVLVSVYPSENVTLDVYLGFDEQPTEVEYFINLTVRVNYAPSESELLKHNYLFVSTVSD